jgi:F-type H+-transporting ATPase subunit epsilon
MADDLLELEIATPERELLRERVSDVQVPGKTGYLGILPGHAALLSELGTGYLTYTAGNRKRYMALHGGYLEVLKDHVRILANRAERADEIDVERARQALERAQARIANPNVGVDIARALTAAARAQARLEAAAHK